MNSNRKILSHHICGQIALKESLFRDVEQQISEVDDSTFSEAKILLEAIKDILEEHYTQLNSLLDKLDAEEIEQGIDEPKRIRLVKTDSSRDADLKRDLVSDAERRVGIPRLSKVFSDNYSALNHIALNSSLFHTTALALHYGEAAAVALKQFQNITPLVLKIGDLLPEIITRELQLDALEVDPSVASIALKNLQAAWRSSL